VAAIIGVGVEGKCRRERSDRCKAQIDKTVRDVAEVVIEILDLGAPIAGERLLRSGAEGLSY
jgi:hypothetical protein